MWPTAPPRWSLPRPSPQVSEKFPAPGSLDYLRTGLAEGAVGVAQGLDYRGPGLRNEVTPLGTLTIAYLPNMDG